MKSSTFLSVIAAGSVLFLAACEEKPGASPQEGEDTIAVVGVEKITTGDLLHELHRRGIDHEERGEQRETVIADLLERKRMVAKARAAGFADRPEIRRAIDSLLINQLLEAELQPRLDSIDVSDDDVEAFYQTNRDQFAQPAHKTVALLFRKSREQDEVRRREHREALLAAVAETRTLGISAKDGFGRISVRNSEHQASRYRGGIIAPVTGQHGEGSLEVELFGRVADLKVGEFTGLIERPEGIYVARVVEGQDGGYRDLEEVRGQIQRELMIAREADLRRQFHVQNEREFPGKLVEEDPGDDT